MMLWPAARLLTVTLWFGGFLALSSALAQSNDKTDTGGGMGGTGNRTEKGLMADIGNTVFPGCADSQLIGRITRARAGESLMQSDEPLCTDRELRTATTETAIIAIFGRGEVVLSPNTIALLRKTADQSLMLHVQSGKFRANHTDDQLTYLIDTATPERRILVSGKQFILQMDSTRTKNDSLRTDIKISAVGDTPTLVRHGDDTFAVKPRMKIQIRIRGEKLFFGRHAQ